MGTQFEKKECRKYGWTKQNTCAHAKFRLRDAIDVNFDPKSVNNYPMQRKPFIVKRDALDIHGTPVEIKSNELVDKSGKNLSILFSEYLSIKCYRDLYKIICEKLKIPYVYFHGERKRLNFDALYLQHPEIIKLEHTHSLDPERKQNYYQQLVTFCVEHGVTSMFNDFVASKPVQKIFNSWIQNFRRKNFYLDCKSGTYHSSDLSFSVKPVIGHWGLKRMTVFVKLKRKA